MKRRDTPMNDAQRAKMLADLRRDAATRRGGYRERALAILPHLCARCGRAFAGKRLPELTVHHKDHNHENNPPDGSNWELLCLYCHAHEHGDPFGDVYIDDRAPEARAMPPPDFQPFAGLDGLFAPKARDPDADGKRK